MDQPKFERLLRLMKMLTANITYSVDDIASHLSISRRSVYRYIDTFRSAGFVINKHGEQFRLSVDSPYFKDISQLVHFTHEEAYMVHQLIDAFDDNSTLKSNLKRKLASVYDYHRVADTIVKGKNATNVRTIIEAIEGRQQVIFRDYSSPNGKSISDREVEPFAFTTNYVQVWCYELSSGKNKIFKTSRIGSVESLDRDWTHAKEHEEGYVDIFRMTGYKQYFVQLELERLAHNLLLEEYPLSEQYITQLSEQKWILKCDVADLSGVARFVVGLADNIKVVDSPELSAYIADFTRKYLS